MPARVQWRGLDQLATHAGSSAQAWAETSPDHVNNLENNYYSSSSGSLHTFCTYCYGPRQCLSLKLQQLLDINVTVSLYIYIFFHSALLRVTNF